MPPQPPELEKTVIGPTPTAGSSFATVDHRPRDARVEMVAGSGPGMAAETESLLRVRLRAATTVLFVSITAFFVRDLFVPDSPTWIMQAGMSAFLGGWMTFLWTKTPLRLRQLRAAELIIFGTTILFLAAYQYQHVHTKAREGNMTYALAAIKTAVMAMFGVIMLYGTFIPNTWRRAAAVVFPVAIVPGIVNAILHYRYDDIRLFISQVVSFEQVSDNVIMLLLGAGAACYGAHIINTLRVEAYKARQLGQYHLKKKIGAGGMGEVYLAEHQLLKRKCAIKLIRPGQQADPLALARFEREVRTTAKLTHWNTIDIYDYGHTDDGTFYYVMEYLRGLSLADLVRNFGPLPPGRVIHLLRQTCRGLREAHEHGLIHRDIKPANIFAAKRGGIYDVAKLLDFGLVKQVAEQTNIQLSHNGSVTGSPLYMSPEQATASREPDARSDIYSLGATAYFLLTGQPPFDGTNPIQVMISHSRDPVVPPSQIHNDIPADLEQIVLRCLAKQPDERYPDVAGLERALAACVDADRWGEDEAACWWKDYGQSSGEWSEASEEFDPGLALTADYARTE